MAACRRRARPPTSPPRGWPTAAHERKKQKNRSVRTVPGDSRRPPRSGAVKDEAAAARRAQQRAQRVANGLAELRSWLRDQVLVGLSATPRRGRADGTRSRGQIAARMVDAQAPGVAAVLRGLSEVPASGEGWPGRLLAEYALLHLLARAHQRLGDLPPDLAATVRSRVGYPTSRQDVLARPPVDRPLGRARRPRPAGRASSRPPPVAARARQRPVGDAAHLRRARPGGRGRRLAGPGHRPAPARDRAATRACTITPASPRCARPWGSGTAEPVRAEPAAAADDAPPCWPGTPPPLSKIPGSPCGRPC